MIVVHVERHVRAHRGRADDAADTGRCEAFDGRAQRLRRAARLEAERGTAAGGRADRLDGIARGCVDDVVAPSSRASSSRDARRSTATIVVQPAIAAAITADSPTAPAPKTARLLPAGGRKTFSTAPAPVWIPQPNGAAISNGIDSSSATMFRSRATECVAKLDWPKKCAWISSPSRESALDPSSGRAAAKLCSKNVWQ